MMIQRPPGSVVTFILALFVTYIESQQNMPTIQTIKCAVAPFCSTPSVSDLANQTGFNESAISDYLQAISNGTDLIRSCSCEPQCVYFNTCCQDYRSPTEIIEPLVKFIQSSQVPPYDCTKVLTESVPVINNCHDKSNKELVKQCIEGTTFQMTVSSMRTKLTYKNLQCGMCNGESVNDLKSWGRNFNCAYFKFDRNGTGKRTATPAIIITENYDSITIINETADFASCHMDLEIPYLPPADLNIHSGIGVYLDSKDICAQPPVSHCPKNASELQKSKCRMSDNNFLLHKDIVYQNQHCLECNVPNMTTEQPTCESCENRDCTHERPSITGATFSFGILVKSYGTKNTVTCRSLAGEKDCSGAVRNLPRCGYGQYLEHGLKTCIDYCSSEYEFVDGQCKEHSIKGQMNHCSTNLTYDQFEELDSSSSHNNKHSLQGFTFKVRTNSSLLCYQCKNLTSFMAKDPEHQNSEILVDGRVVPNNLIYRDSNHTRFFCADGHDHHKEEEIATLVCLTISIVSLVLYFGCFASFRRLRNIPGQIVAGNMFFLLLSYITFLMRQGVEKNESACTVTAIMLHYFLMTAFSFMVIYAAFIIHSLDFIDFESEVSYKTTIKLWLVGILMALIVVVPALIMDFVDWTNVLGDGYKIYTPGYGGEECFISHGAAILIYFIGPVGVFLLISVLLYGTIIFKLMKLARETSKVRTNHREKIAIAIKLCIVLGFNWIFAVVAAVAQEDITAAIFIATCSLQGFFGFIVFICNTRTLNDLRACTGQKTNSRNDMTTASSKSTLQKRNTSQDLTKNLLTKQDTFSSTLPDC